MFEPGKIIKTCTSRKGKEIVIRYPQWEDLNEMLRFINELSAEDTYITYSGETISKDEEIDWLAKVLKDLEKKNGSFIYAFDGKIMVGSCAVSRREKRKEHVGRIGISVAKEYREEGVGAALFETILSEAKDLGFTIVDLEVYGTNDRAYNLYKKFGFIEAGRAPGMVRYKDSFLEEIWMYKSL